MGEGDQGFGGASGMNVTAKRRSRTYAVQGVLAQLTRRGEKCCTA